MILYTCRNRKRETGEPLPCTNTPCETSFCPACGGKAEAVSELYWCNHCKIPLYEKKCSLCGQEGKRFTTDIRPVFPEERLLLEIIIGKPFAYLEESVWNGAGNHYYINGHRISFPIHRLKELDCHEIRNRYETLKHKNTEEYFEIYRERFVKANHLRYEEILEEAGSYIREKASDAEVMDMFVSFSGGKDSTVTSDLVIRALGNPEIMHIFGDTTLEFPFTYEYVKRFRKEHAKTPVVSARNKEKDFEKLCRMIGPPSRVMRWCCTIFKTGMIQRKIKSLFREKNRILTFYGIRRSESVSRSKYDRESDSPKITKQRIISPIIDWMDFDIWLYIFSTGIDFNEAYRLGYARVGCWCCPNNSVWSEFLSSVHMPEQWEQFHRLLVEFAESIGKEDAEEYVKEGGWKARQGGNGVDYARKSVVSFRPCATEENTFYYDLQRPVSTELYELFRPFGYLDFEIGNARLGEVYVLNQKGEILLKLQGCLGSKELKVAIINVKLAGTRDLKAAEERVKCQITKYQMCMGCLACESVCKYNALSIKEEETGEIKYRILEEKCLRCGACVNHFNAGCYMRKVLSIKRT